MSAGAASGLRRRAWRITRILCGSLLLVVGAVGLALPVLPGIASILAGLAVLATELPWARRLLQRLRERLRAARGVHGSAGAGGPDRRAREGRDAQGGGKAG